MRIVVYEDNDDLRDSLNSLLNSREGFELSGSFSNCNNVENDMLTCKPDVVLMDIDMPGTNGIEGLKRIKGRFQNVEIIMLTVFDDDKHVFECICNGAGGYLLKKSSPDKIIEALLDVRNGGAPMTASIARQVLKMFPQNSRQMSGDGNQLSIREKDVLFLLVKGYSYKMIAAELSIAHDTVRSHIKKIYEKLHVHTMTEAVAKAIKERIV